MNTLIETIINLADQFGEIARKVGESSQQRKVHAENAKMSIENSLLINSDIDREMKIISKINSELQKINNSVLHTCIILSTNIEYQLKFKKDLWDSGVIDKKNLELLESKCNALSKYLNDAQVYIYQILEINDRILLMNNLIIRRKIFQKRNLEQLKRHTERILSDSEKAIAGAESNFKRGQEMTNRFKSINELIASKDKEKISSLIDDASQGWKIAKDVNKSSVSQIDFAEKVNRFTKQLYQDSLAIKELIFSKHDYSERNSKLFAELPRIFNEKFMEYLDISHTWENLEYDENVPELITIAINNLKAHVDIAIEDIKRIHDLNYNMTNQVMKNLEVEKKCIHLSNQEIEYFDQIKFEVISMTDATKYPVQGSQQNISNGQEIEKNLKAVLKKI